ncbi:hypothetical protein [Halomarina rubra]|uniref:DUF8156 domain-containing protein n=1 Tax=Halomarina rubra TaxID=2071873 RepID=A0ABD6AZD1_9EURY|nr:hypothetical protein [Halomarina rubra]
MGRTNPTYRDYLGSLEERWSDFRRALRLEAQPAYDECWAHAQAHAHAGGMVNYTDPIITALVSMHVEQQRELMELREQMEGE